MPTQPLFSAGLRLFVAVPLPPDTRRLLLGLQKDCPRVRWCREETLHLTLRFLGQTERSRLPGLVRALSGVRVRAFETGLGQTGFFARGPRKILWAGLEASEELLELHARVDEALAALPGMGRDRRWTPHLTLGRGQEPGPSLEELRRWAAGPLPGARFRVTDFVLFRSELLPGGPRHTPLERFPLEP